MNRDYIIRMAREAGLPKWYQTDGIANEELVVKFANLVAAAERETCAKRLDAVGCDHCAENIRLRDRE